ncbi:MAG TPA: DoxX family protein [Rhizomicrobium sp.]|nr:DoxX family protein [Rhizomicrobium sp.]
MREDLGKLILRVTVGALLLFHGVHKLLNGIAPIKAMLASRNLPEALSYGVYLGEIAGPILLVLGAFSRIGAGLVVVNMAVAVALAGASRLAAFDPMGGYALELEAFFLFGALAVLFLGAGRLSLGGGRWN